MTLLTPHEEHICQRLSTVDWHAQSDLKELRRMCLTGNYNTVRLTEIRVAKRSVRGYYLRRHAGTAMQRLAG